MCRFDKRSSRADAGMRAALAGGGARAQVGAGARQALVTDDADVVAVVAEDQAGARARFEHAGRATEDVHFRPPLQLGEIALDLAPEHQGTARVEPIRRPVVAHFIHAGSVVRAALHADAGVGGARRRAKTGQSDGAGTD
ncbi:MAG TPA: hypothetical protein DCW29_12630 [Janthinobacterium sp.]|nr:hypothetical protein [Janthinobacterium sp.]